MFVTKALARLTMFAGLMALPNAIPTAVYAQQAVTVGATDIGGAVVGASGRKAGPAAQPHRGASTERSGGGALFSGDLLVRDDENSAGRRVRRQERYSRK